MVLLFSYYICQFGVFRFGGNVLLNINTLQPFFHDQFNAGESPSAMNFTLVLNSTTGTSSMKSCCRRVQLYLVFSMLPNDLFIITAAALVYALVLRSENRGQVAMANSGYPNSNGCQFFFTLDKTPWLDQKV